ncbi:MAG: 16S rRNA (guanine(527)-N(7))-methyltransferase RsmG [Spirochaetia bacterium]|nr:16S rRNA (guanine(527)-N(7))-methyltransferase RsmG [Spirochaetia bacterium]
MKPESRDLLTKSLHLIPLGLEPAKLSEAIEVLLRYADFLLDYNEKVNLVGAKTEEDFITKHLVDSLAALPLLPRKGRLADVGSGGGLPGIPLSLFWDGPVTLIESKNKKAAFLNSAAKHLALKNLKVLCSNAAEVAEKFDAVVTRAFSDIHHALKLCIRMSRPGTTFFFYKGTREAITAELSTEDPKNYSIHPLSVPFLNAERHMVKWPK